MEGIKMNNETENVPEHTVEEWAVIARKYFRENPETLGAETILDAIGVPNHLKTLRLDIIPLISSKKPEFNQELTLDLPPLSTRHKEVRNTVAERNPKEMTTDQLARNSLLVMEEANILEVPIDEENED